MSVLIKGMDMPKGCKDCELLYKGEDQRFHCPLNGYLQWVEYEDVQDYIVDDDCPLVSVPTPHGDLIDRDALNYNANYFEPLIHKADIDWMPTIIEAESE